MSMSKDLSQSSGGKNVSKMVHQRSLVTDFIIRSSIRKQQDPHIRLYVVIAKYPTE